MKFSYLLQFTAIFLARMICTGPVIQQWQFNLQNCFQNTEKVEIDMQKTEEFGNYHAVSADILF